MKPMTPEQHAKRIEQEVKNQNDLEQLAVKFFKERNVPPPMALHDLILTAMQIAFKCNNRNLRLSECAKLITELAQEQEAFAHEYEKTQN